MKKYIVHCIVVSGLFFVSITSSMDLLVQSDKISQPSSLGRDMQILDTFKSLHNLMLTCKNFQQCCKAYLKQCDEVEIENAFRALAYTCNPYIVYENARYTYDCGGNRVDHGIGYNEYRTCYRKQRPAAHLLFMRTNLLISKNCKSILHGYGDYLLQGASLTNDLKMVSLLLEKGANPNVKKKDDIPFFFIITNLKVAELFFKHPELDRKASCEGYPNALWYPFVSSNRKNEIISFFLEKGIDPNVIDEKGNNLLHHIASWADNRVSWCLDEWQTSPKISDFKKTTKSILKAINPAAINAKNDKDETPIDTLKIILKKRVHALSLAERELINALGKKFGYDPDLALRYVQHATLNKSCFLEFMQLFLNFHDKHFPNAKK